MATFPQVLLCILAVVAIFIFILATLICCLLRFIGRPDYITASDAAYYDKIDTSNEKSYLLDTAHESPDETYYGYVKPTLIYQTLEPNKKVKRYSMIEEDDQPLCGARSPLPDQETEAFLTMKSSCKLWRSWNSQVHNIALPTGNSAETQL